jgi:hypothetical protein
MMSPRKILSALAVSSLLLAASIANAASTRSGNQTLPSSPQRSTLFEDVINRGGSDDRGGGKDDDREFHNNGKGHEHHGHGHGHGHDHGHGHGHDDDDDSPGS